MREPRNARDTNIAALDGDAARRCADLYGIATDLAFVIRLCNLLVELRQDPVENGESEQAQADSADDVARALWTTALVVYARCFASGKRFGLDESDVKVARGEALEAHRYLIDLRNKHIAHSVNPFEQVQVGALLETSEDGSLAIVGIAGLSVKHVSGTQGWFRNLATLAATLLIRVQSMQKAAEADALEDANRIGAEELAGRPPVGLTVPGPKDTSRPRP